MARPGPGPAEPSAPAGEQQHPRWMLPVVLVATFMAQFDLYVVNVALPAVRHDLGMGDALVELVVSGYAFAYAAGLVIGGRLGDLHGHRRLYVIGMIGFGLASLACGTAGTGALLVAFRVAQGAAAAMMVPQVLALISAVYPPPARGRALSWFGVTIGVGAIAGQVVGGLLLQADVAGLGWRSVFLVNMPVALMAVALAGSTLPGDTGHAGVARLGGLGAGAVTLALCLVLVPMTFGRTEHWPLWCWVSLACAGAVGAVALAHEGRLERLGGAPVVPPSLFREPAFTVGLLLALTQFAAFFSLVFCLTLVLQDGIGVTPMQAGLAFAPLGCAFAGASIGMRGVVARRGATAVVLGSLVVAAAMAEIAWRAAVQGGHLATVDVVAPLVVIGLGNGTAIPAVIGQVLHRVRPAHAGAASGLLTTAQQFASALGVAVIGGVFFTHLTSPSLDGHARALVRAAAMDAVLMAVAAGLAAVLARFHRTT